MDNIKNSVNNVRLKLFKCVYFYFSVMSYIHKQTPNNEFYIYRDLKPDNILIKVCKLQWARHFLMCSF